MKTYSKRWSYLFLTVFSFFIFNTNSAYALVITQSESIVDWGTLNITMDTGVSIIPRDVQAERTHASSKINLGMYVNTYDYESVSVDDWTSNIGSSANYTSGANVAQHNTDVVNSDLLRSQASVNSSGSEYLTSSGGAQRDFNFTVMGEGYITFSIDYSYSLSVSTDGSGTGSAGAVVVTTLNNLSNENGGLLDPALLGDDAFRQDFYGAAQSMFGESVADSNFGTMSATGFFADGDAGFFLVQSLANASYRAPSTPTTVSEPMSCLLMAGGLVGLSFMRKRKDL